MCKWNNNIFEVLLPCSGIIRVHNTWSERKSSLLRRGVFHDGSKYFVSLNDASLIDSKELLILLSLLVYWYYSCNDITYLLTKLYY